MRRPLTIVLILLTLAILACSKKSGTGDGTCPGGGYSCDQLCASETPPPECDDACDDSTPCPAGFYCGDDGTCSADCEASGDELCPNGICTADGECEAPPAGGGGGGGGGDGAGGGGGVCARESVTGTHVTPNVVLVIDRSGSMGGELDTSSIECDCDTAASDHDCYHNDCDENEHLSRWDQLRDVLIGTGGADVGLIGNLESQVRFGIALYTESDSQAGCPDMTYAPNDPGVPGPLNVALDQYDEIAEVYNGANPGTYTPTADAINAVMSQIEDAGLLEGPDPTIIVLATDGRPGSCGDLDDYNDEHSSSMDDSVAAVEAAFEANVRTFVIAVGHPDDVPEYHINALANAGVGDNSGETESATRYYVDDVTELETALNTIIGNTLSCTIALEGTISNPAAGCGSGGEVEFITQPGDVRTEVPCDPDNGWSIVDSRTIELNGSSCMTLQNTPNIGVEVSFPCGGIIIDPV